MTIFNEPRGHVIDANSGSVVRLFGIAAAAFVLVLLIFASVARVDSGHVWGPHLVRTGDGRSLARGRSFG